MDSKTNDDIDDLNNLFVKQLQINKDTPEVVVVDDIYNLLDDKYFNKTKGTDINSLKYLIDIPITQSSAIKLGFVLEKTLLDQILKYTILENIKGKNCKGEKEKDHLLKDETNKIIYYAELKGNLNLDTEKSRATMNKCILIYNNLTEQYPLYDIKMSLVSLRFLSSTKISRTIKKKYGKIISNILGLNDYLEMLKSKVYTIDTQKEFYNRVVERIQHNI
jgi:hypothetical protein